MVLMKYMHFFTDCSPECVSKENCEAAIAIKAEIADLRAKRDFRKMRERRKDYDNLPDCSFHDDCSTRCGGTCYFFNEMYF